MTPWVKSRKGQLLLGLISGIVVYVVSINEGRLSEMNFHSQDESVSRELALRIPELSLCFLAFFLNFLWEVIHTYFYTFKDSHFDTMLYGWLHCAPWEMS